MMISYRPFAPGSISSARHCLSGRWAIVGEFRVPGTPYLFPQSFQDRVMSSGDTHEFPHEYRGLHTCFRSPFRLASSGDTILNSAEFRGHHTRRVPGTPHRVPGTRKFRGHHTQLRVTSSGSSPSSGDTILNSGSKVPGHHTQLRRELYFEQPHGRAPHVNRLEAIDPGQVRL